MKKNLIQKVYFSNGFADEQIKFVEVEGKKFIDDGTGKPKLDDKQQPIPFEEKKSDADADKINLEDADLETLSKKNPHVARMLKEAQERKEAEDKRIEDDKKKADEDKAKKGEWQKLAEERDEELKTAKEKVNEKDKMLSKYVETVKTILETAMKSIPADRLSLIPAEFSERQKLEYILKNATVLGATSIFGKGDGVPPNNDKKPSYTDEEKLVTRFDELQKKGATRTRAESDEMLEVAQKIKKLRTEKQQ